ncbi:MAG: hypothetical protein HYZ81_09990 [Nitrospinae bacterium]|nr:hypothetical protein [Nitrospinota bacterium]
MKGKVAVCLRVLGFLMMLFLCSAFLQVELVLQGRIPRSLPTTELLALERPIQGHPVQAIASETPARQTPVAVGMRKDQVRIVWGTPAEVRKIRTCFGTAEEWVYRGDPQRFGAGERVLHFDEDEILTEIK